MKHLSTIYREIGEKAVQTPNWPASQNFRSMLVQSPHDGSWQPPRFQRDGPLAIVALIDKKHNPELNAIVQTCLACFDDFVQHATRIAPCHFIPSKVPHTCILIFQEHPSLLPKQERQDWQPVSETTVQQLQTQLDTTIPTFSKIPLTLDSILLTPDGAMIAGFVTDDPQYYSQFKATVAQVGQTCLQGRLTSRPKNLIHVTLGRFLGFQNSVTPTQQTQLQALVRQFNHTMLPTVVRGTAGDAPLHSISLLRNLVWLCEENQIYQTYELNV